MEAKMTIPKMLKVGYQKREDTFTKKLAYVIYVDEKGKVRKEGSWNSWRDKEMNVDDFENVPTSGFVLNKKVGDYKSDWNHRMAHIRVYDPRGFEFEIGVENLLYILEEWKNRHHIALQQLNGAQILRITELLRAYGHRRGL